MNATPVVFGKVVIVGGGAMGRLLASSLAERCRAVLVYDIDSSRSGALPGDATRPDKRLLQDIGTADVVILALPGCTLPQAISAIGPRLHADALLVETASVKNVLTPVLAELPDSVDHLGINPMFAPSVGFARQNVAIVPGKGSLMSRHFEGCLRDLGAQVFIVSAARHDQIVATVQAATHAAILGFGTALLMAEVDLDDMQHLGTPPFRCLLLLLARILTGNPEVYWDIQAHNPSAETARKAVMHGLMKCDQLSRHPDEFGAFEEWLSHLATPVRPLLPALEQECRALFAANDL